MNWINQREECFFGEATLRHRDTLRHWAHEVTQRQGALRRAEVQMAKPSQESNSCSLDKQIVSNCIECQASKFRVYIQHGVKVRYCNTLYTHVTCTCKQDNSTGFCLSRNYHYEFVLWSFLVVVGVGSGAFWTDIYQLESILLDFSGSITVIFSCVPFLFFFFRTFQMPFFFRFDDVAEMRQRRMDGWISDAPIRQVPSSSKLTEAGAVRKVPIFQQNTVSIVFVRWGSPCKSTEANATFLQRVFFHTSQVSIVFFCWAATPRSAHSCADVGRCFVSSLPSISKALRGADIFCCCQHHRITQHHSHWWQFKEVASMIVSSSTPFMGPGQE